MMTCGGAAGGLACFAQQNLMQPHLYIGDKRVKGMDQGGRGGGLQWDISDSLTSLDC